MVLLLMALACTSENTEDLHSSTDPIITSVEVADRRVKYPQQVLQKRYQVLLKKYGPARIVGLGDVANNEWFYDYYPYASLLHQTLGWDFIVLANIEAREGIGFINELVADIDQDHPNYETAIEIHQTVRLTDESNPSLVRQAFKDTRDPNLSDEIQLELWFSMYEKGVHYRSGEKNSTDLVEENFPRSYKISKETGIN